MQLSSETERRITAEMKSEEAENKLRESEGTLAAVRSSEVHKLKEENEELCERLAFVEVEAVLRDSALVRSFSAHGHCCCHCYW